VRPDLTHFRGSRDGQGTNKVGYDASIMGRHGNAFAILLLLLAPLLAGDRDVTVVAVEDAGYEAYLRFVPRNPSGRLDWLLVTPAEFVDAFAPLVKHRRQTGLAAEVVTTEEVDRDVLLGGGDFPERLRNLVRELHARHGLRYLVLGGDSGRLAPRMVPFGMKGPKVHHGEPFAGESYFGCLDGEWNGDADALFGESEPGNRDRPDTKHEVHVGRIPVESTREVETYVAKLLAYERPTHLDYQDRVAYLGGKVFQDGDADAFYRRLHADRFGPAGFTPAWFTKKGDGAALADVQRHLSAGVGIVCHYHHSFSYNLSLPTGAIDTGNVAAIGNAGRPFVVFSNGCYSNQFTKEGISEKLLLSPDGGAVAFVGSTNTCYSSALALEVAFWAALFDGKTRTLGEALSTVRAGVGADVGVMGFLRLSFNLLGDPATPLWKRRPVRADFRVEARPDGSLKITVKGAAACRISVHQSGALAAWRDPVNLGAGEETATFRAVIGNGEPLDVTLSGAGIVPVTKTVPDPVPLHLASVRVLDGAVRATLSDGREVVVPLPPTLEPGSFVNERTIESGVLRIVVPVLDGSDVAFVRGQNEFRMPGFARLDAPRENGLPHLLAGRSRLLAVWPTEGAAVAPDIDVESTDATIRLGWQGEPGARWLVERDVEGGRRLLTPVPLVNPVFEMTGLSALEPVRFVITRLGLAGETRVDASTTFAFQRGFPQRIGANVTSVQVLDLDGRRGPEVLFGDDKLGLWALHADGSEVRHAGDSWTFGLFAAIENGVFEPIVADIIGSRAPEILATSKLKDCKLYAFDRKGKPVPGFPVKFRSRLMTPPLVGDFDGKKGNEILVVSGFGKTIELVRPDGTKEPFATIGQYNYAYPIAVNLDRDRALEVVLLDGAGKVWALDQGGKPMKGFPVDLGGPGRATPMVANLDKDRGLEIVAVGKGTTRLAVIDALSGKVQADLVIPGAGKPANYSHFYPALADLGDAKIPSIVVGTPSKKLFAFDLVKGATLVVRAGFPVDLSAEARGIAAVDVDGDGRDELFLSLHDGNVVGLDPDGNLLPGFPLGTKADTYAAPLLMDLDGDGDLELFLGAADGVLRVWDLPYRIARRHPTWRGLQNGPGLPGRPGRVRR
jgi:peptidase C25-like protein